MRSSPKNRTDLDRISSATEEHRRDSKVLNELYAGSVALHAEVERTELVAGEGVGAALEVEALQSAFD